MLGGIGAGAASTGGGTSGVLLAVDQVAVPGGAHTVGAVVEGTVKDDSAPPVVAAVAGLADAASANEPQRRRPWRGWDLDLDTPPADDTWDDPTRYPWQ
jgi:hypothetical protein